MSADAKPAKIVVVGAGPTGLGAAVRLTELKHPDWHVYDCGAVPGGLSRSYQDSHGFTWDLGGHVIFSHYQYFDDLMNAAVQDWNTLQRVSYVRMANEWVPYPFQNNIHRLPKALMEECLHGVEEATEKLKANAYDAPPANFEEHFHRQFGSGICRLFMEPYNFKVWAVPPRLMSTEWVGERVAIVDVDRIKKNIAQNTDDVGWGPNATFRFPQKGGTGGIYRNLQQRLPQDRFSIGDANRIVAIRPTEHVVVLSSGAEVAYDTLLATMPLDDVLRMVADGLEKARDGPSDVSPARLRELADQLVFSSTHVIGLGIKGDSPPDDLKEACWLYFPEDNTPFYRCTVFSNYAASNAPAGHWSLMLEVSENANFKPVDAATVVEDTVKGCLAAGLLRQEDVIVSRWHHREFKGYPTPFVGRNTIVTEAHDVLEKHFAIYARGRFGAWRYEVANQDHSVMQGVEAVDHLLRGSEEETLRFPNRVNSTRGTTHCTLWQQQ